MCLNIHEMKQAAQLVLDWHCYIKTQLSLRIATQVSVIKVNVNVTKIENQFPLNDFSLLWPIDTKLGVWVAYIKTQLGIATQVSVIKAKVTVAKIEIHCPCKCFNLHELIVLKNWFRRIAALLVLNVLKPPGQLPGERRFNTVYPDSLQCLPASLRCGPRWPR